MVEKIEDVDAELHSRARTCGHVLDDRKIRVVEAWSGDGVARQVSEAVDCGERRRIEPPIDRSDDLDWSRQIRTNGVGCSVETAVAGDDVDGIAALRLDDGRKLPAARERVPLEGQFIGCSEDESVTRIEVGEPILAGKVVAVLNGVPARTKRVRVFRL